MSRSPATVIGLASAGVLAVGYGVATYAYGQSVGENIPINQENLRTQGAQGEAVKSGMSPDEAKEKIKKVATKGGDQGIRSAEADSNPILGK